MSKCADCRKNEAIDTNWERLVSWFMWHIFPKHIKDERNSAYSMGLEDGYRLGRKHERELSEIRVDRLIALLNKTNGIPKS